MFNLASLPNGSFYSSEVNTHWLSCIATQSWSITILINALWSSTVQWVPHFHVSWRKLFPILFLIFSFWTHSHPYTFLRDLYSFLGKESKCSCFEITIPLLSATKPFQVLPDKGSLANILWSTCFLGAKGKKALLPFSWPLMNRQTNPSPCSHLKKHSGLDIHKAVLMSPRQTLLMLTFQSEAKPKLSKYTNKIAFFLVYIIIN